MGPKYINVHRRAPSEDSLGDVGKNNAHLAETENELSIPATAHIHMQQMLVNVDCISNSCSMSKV